MTLKSKISSMTTIFWLFQPYSYVLWKVVYRNTRYVCIILVAKIIWRSGHAISSCFPLDFFLHYSCRRVFTVFYVTLCNMIVLAARFIGTLLAAKSYFQCKKSGQRELARRQGRLSTINQKIQKKKSCHRHFNC